VANVPKTIEPGFVKICGVTTVADALFVATSGASALGLNFAESSRRVTKVRAREIMAVTDGALLRSAIFRDADDDYVLEHLEGLGVEMVQVHGVLSDALLDQLRSSSVMVVKALNIEGDEFEGFDDAAVDAVLIDGPRPGSGVAHSWERLGERDFKVPVIAAGGLDPANVGDVIATTSVDGVDVASGVERAPGIKDDAGVTNFVSNAREAFAARGVR
jgi:phosphoribosylanthranilate isomerase